MREDVHQILAPKSSPPDAHGREAVPMLLEGLWMEVRSLRRADEAFSQAHWRPSFSV
ncbi:UNVERIFIED_CONTAM: hypothetical protein GTU68_064388 [Idotea baltica]|nr:hypothetical protein [Idotea baltica]